MTEERHRSVEKVLKIWVQPRASRDEILGYRDELLRIRLQASPTEGEANRQLRKVLAEALGVSLSQVEIVHGHKSRRKQVRIRDVNPTFLAELENLRESKR